MSAEVLREAARLMRERAENATPGPWRLQRRDHGGPVVGSDDGPVLMGYASGARDVYFAAAMHPAVALAVADWLDDIGTRHAPDSEPVELMLHYDEECPTGECEDAGHSVIACSGCYPSYEGMDGRCVYPCIETKAALAVAHAYLGETS